MRIFIDTTTGVWGRADDIVILDEVTSESFQEGVEEMSDSQIMYFGNAFGDAITLPKNI